MSLKRADMKRADVKRADVKRADVKRANVKYTRDHLRSLIDEVAEGGQEVVVTRRGEPVARLAPIEIEPRRLPSLAAFRSSIRVKGRPLSEEVVAARDEERY